MDSRVWPAHVLNAYNWALMKANLGMSESQYPDNKRPIIPSGQEPEFINTDKPFIVYGFAEDASNMNLGERSGTLVYAIYADNNNDINSISTLLIETLGKYDESAAFVNTWTSKPAQSAFLGCRFGSISVAFGEGPGPETSEAGRAAGTLTIRYNCFLTYQYGSSASFNIIQP